MQQSPTPGVSDFLELVIPEQCQYYPGTCMRLGTEGPILISNSFLLEAKDSHPEITHPAGSTRECQTGQLLCQEKLKPRFKIKRNDLKKKKGTIIDFETDEFKGH